MISAAPNVMKPPAMDPREISSKRKWAITVGVMTGLFLAALEATVIATAMPTVIASLGGMEHYSWVFSAYLLASTVTVPIWGKLSDLYGRRPIYQVGIAIFLLGSALSGLAASMNQLIAFRAIQGLGAGALVPVGMTIIGDIFTLRERAKMQAFFSGVWGLASVIGPLIGGFLTDQLSWRWVFYINIPIGIAAAVIIGLALIEPKPEARPVVDYAGAAALAVCVTLLLMALVETDSFDDLLRPEPGLMLLGSAAALAAFITIERRAREPIVPLDLFRNGVVTVAVVVGFLSGVAMFGAITFVPLFAQGARGATATEAGSMLTPLMLSWVAMSILGGRLVLRIGFKSLTVAGLLALTTGFVILSTFGRTTPRSWLILDLCLIGTGLGLTMLTLLLAVQQSVPRTQLGIATSLNQFSRSIGGAVGVAIMGALITSSFNPIAARLAGELPGLHGRGSAAEALIDPQLKSQIGPAALIPLQDALAASTRNGFVLCAVLSALAFLVVLKLPHVGIETHPHELPDSGERAMMAEFTVIDPEHEPVCVEET
jgi:EmrB/QacA subfamily drug resistance transporter